MTTVRASNNRVVYGYVDEATFDTQPTTAWVKWAGALSDNIGPNPEFLESDEENGSFVIEDHHFVGMSTAGSVEIEYRHSAHDWAIQKALNAQQWTSAEAGGGVKTVTFANAGGINQMTISSGNWDDEYASAPIARGKWLYVVAVNPENSGYFRVESAVNSSTINVGGLTTMVAESSLTTDNVTVLADVSNGTTLQTFALQRDYFTASDRYSILLGQLITGITGGFDSAKSIFRGSVAMMGTRELTSASGLAGSSSGPTTNTQFTTADCLGYIEDLLAVAPTPVVSWSFNIDKGDFKFETICDTRPVQLGLGRMNIRGQITTYYQNDDLYSRAISETGSNVTAFAGIMENSQGALICDFPQIRLSNPRRSRGRRDEGLLVTYDFLADNHSPSSAAVRFARRTV